VRIHLLPVTIACVILTVMGCAPAAQNQRQEQGAAVAAAPSGPKVLRMGMRAADAPDPSAGGVGFNNEEVGYMLHSSLAVYDPTTNVLHPRLAERVPTLETGDWTVLPDNKMEVTWKLRPNVTWHDGTPLGAEDFVLGFRITMDPEMFARGTAVIRSIEDVTAPDPQTVVVRWKSVYIFANAMLKNTLVPLPRHLVADAYDSGNKTALAASPLWTTEWVGLGPYRLDQWLQGSYIEVVANDAYVLGRPVIDRISIRLFGDVNTLLATILAGDIDVAPGGAFKQEEGNVLKTEWEARGAGTVIANFNDLRHGKPSWRYPDAPWAQDVRVRQALVHMIDRQGMVDTLKYGLSAVADIPLLPEDPVYKLAQQRGVPSYPYDVARAHRLLGEAGLTRGPDGMFRAQSGDPFTIQVSATADIASQVQELVVIADQWKAAGLDASPFPIPDGASDRDELRAKSRGIIVRGLKLDYTSFAEFTMSEISSESTRWKGNNMGGYNNPSYDQQVSRLLTTARPTEREQAGVDLVRRSLEEVVWIPLFYGANVAVYRKGVQGVTKVMPAQDVLAWNVHLWQVD